MGSNKHAPAIDAPIQISSRGFVRQLSAPQDAGFFDYESCAHDPPSLGDVKRTLADFDFSTGSDSEVVGLASSIFDLIHHEAKALLHSPLTAAMAKRCVLKHRNISNMLAQVLASKAVWPMLPRDFSIKADPIDCELLEHERAMRKAMLEVLSKPSVLRAVIADLSKTFLNDPAAESFLQLVLYFKGFHALTLQRVAHDMWLRGDPVSKNVALMLQSRSSELFAVDIHPGATIGNGIMIDHATGVVIGATAIVGNEVVMLHQVTLGATGKPTGNAKRHPTVEDRVVLGAGSIVLGDTTIGADSTIGAMAIVSKNVDPGSTVVEVNRVISRKIGRITSRGSSMSTIEESQSPHDVSYVGMWSI